MRRVVNAVSQADTNENTADSVEPGDAYDGSLANRRDLAVAQAVADVRGAIRTAGRFPFSATESAVPPEGVHHTLTIAAYRLINSTPGLVKEFMLGDSGKAFVAMYQEACRWVEGLRKGDSFTEPSDPVGRDWATAVSTSNLAVTGIRWADWRADDDEYDAGVTADGAVVSRLLNNMNQDI